MSFSTTDTIVAIATPPGRGGIGVVRLSGSNARRIAQQLITHEGALEPRYATFARVRPAAVAAEKKVRLKPDTTEKANEAIEPTIRTTSVVSGFSRTELIDQAVVTYFPAPASYTG